MGPSIPRGPGEGQIKTEAYLEQERVKFEDEKRRFIERVGSYETIARSNLSGERASFEVSDWTPMDSAGLFIPAKFDPTFDPNTSKQLQGQRLDRLDLSWFNADNLGFQWTPPPPPPPPRHPLQLMFGGTFQDRTEWRQQNQNRNRNNP